MHESELCAAEQGVLCAPSHTGEGIADGDVGLAGSSGSDGVLELEWVKSDELVVAGGPTCGSVWVCIACAR